MDLFDRGHALLIGVGQYSDPAWDAPIAAHDAEAMHDALVDPQFGAYPRGQVKLIKDTQATRAGVADGFAQLANRTSASDTVLIAFTGHGAMGDDNLYYLATHDTVFTPAQQIKSETGFSAVDLIRALRMIEAQKLLLVINACFSGHISPTLGTTSVDETLQLGAVLPDRFGNEILATGEGRAIITASRPDQYSYFQPTATHTYFGQAVLDGLRGGSGSARSGFVGLYELYQQVYAQVKQAVAKISREQEPMLTVMQGVGPFPVARYPGSTSGLGVDALQPQPPAHAAVRVVERDVITAIGANSIAFKAEAGSAVNIDQSQHKRSLIDFGTGNKFGGVSVGDVVEGDLTKTVYNTPAVADPKQELLDKLDKFAERVGRLDGVDADVRDDAVYQIQQGRAAAEQGNADRMRKRLTAAHDLLTSMEHATATSIAKKVAVLLN